MTSDTSWGETNKSKGGRRTQHAQLLVARLAAKAPTRAAKHPPPNLS